MMFHERQTDGKTAMFQQPFEQETLRANHDNLLLFNEQNG